MALYAIEVSGLDFGQVRVSSVEGVMLQWLCRLSQVFQCLLLVSIYRFRHIVGQLVT